jgi:hypothetical protein
MTGKKWIATDERLGTCELVATVEVQSIPSTTGANYLWLGPCSLEITGHITFSGLRKMTDDLFNTYNSREPIPAVFKDGETLIAECQCYVHSFQDSWMDAYTSTVKCSATGLIKGEVDEWLKSINQQIEEHNRQEEAKLPPPEPAKMVFDWHKAARLIKETNAEWAMAGLSGDWDHTGGFIYEDGKPASKKDRDIFLASDWATPTLILPDGEHSCWRSGKEVKRWGAETYWPPSARRILAQST